jgi:hypothetical protein
MKLGKQIRTVIVDPVKQQTVANPERKAPERELALPTTPRR